MKNYEFSENSTDEYKLEDAYVVLGRGVGRLDLEKAAKSKAFRTRAKNLAAKINKIEVFQVEAKS